MTEHYFINKTHDLAVFLKEGRLVTVNMLKEGGGDRIQQEVRWVLDDYLKSENWEQTTKNVYEGNELLDHEKEVIKYALNYLRGNIDEAVEDDLEMNEQEIVDIVYNIVSKLDWKDWEGTTKSV